MKKILLVIAVLMTQAMSAQVFCGESKLFGLKGYIPRPHLSMKEVLGQARYYIGEKGESTYTLINKHGISSATIDRIRKGNGISTMKIDDLCKILHCKVEDIIEFVDE